MYDDYLAHHGIKNQRWGVRHGPPYPVEKGAGGRPKTTTVLKSKLKSAVSKGSSTIERYKKVKAERDAIAAANKTKNDADKAIRNKEQLRKHIVEHPKSIYKYKEMFDKKELESIIADIQFDRKLKDVRAEEINRGQQAFRQVTNYVTTTKDFLMAGKEIYNLYVDINNVQPGAKKLKRLGGKGNEKDEKTEAKTEDKKDDD